MPSGLCCPEVFLNTECICRAGELLVFNFFGGGDSDVLGR